MIKYFTLFFFFLIQYSVSCQNNLYITHKYNNIETKYCIDSIWFHYNMSNNFGQIYFLDDIIIVSDNKFGIQTLKIVKQDKNRYYTKAGVFEIESKYIILINGNVKKHYYILFN